MTEFRAYKRGRILDVLLERLRGIRVELTYQTDAGRNVTLGRSSTATGDDRPSLALIPGETRTLVTSGRDILRELPITVEGLMSADRTDPIAPVEAMLGDVKRALFGAEDQTLGGLIIEQDGLQYGEERHVDTEPGSGIVGGQVDLVVKYRERFGDPTQ